MPNCNCVSLINTHGTKFAALKFVRSSTESKIMPIETVCLARFGTAKRNEN